MSRSESTTPEASVVITCFNYGHYLAEAVDSARTQSPRPHVIVVDDGSTDANTHEALENLPADVMLVRQANSGVCAARNAGWRRSGTPFVLFLDADDRLVPGALELLSGPLRAYPQLGYAYGTMRFFGSWEGTMPFPPFDPYRLLYRHTVGLSAMVRRNLLVDTGGFDPAFEHFEDWELWVNALAHGWRGHQVDAVTLEYRRHEQVKHHGDRRNYRQAWRALRSKHARLYRDRALVRESALGPVQRLAHRLYWGPRPVPAWAEAAVYGWRWRSS